MLLCHVGQIKNARGLLSCCTFHRKRFPELKIILVLSQPPSVQELLPLKDLRIEIQIITTQDFSKAHQEFESMQWLNTDFRDAFWRRTTERFFYLCDYFEVSNANNVIHIEYDVALFDDPELIISRIPSLFSVALPLDNTRAIGSIVFFRDENAITSLCNHFLKIRPITDMHGLNDFFLNHPMDCLAFPTVPPSLLSYNSPLHSRLSASFDLFDSLFDAAALGQFFFGIDPLNSDGLNTKGFVNEETSIPLSASELIWLREKQLSHPFLKISNEFYRISNIHMHCKNFNMLNV